MVVMNIYSLWLITSHYSPKPTPQTIRVARQQPNAFSIISSYVFGTHRNFTITKAMNLRTSCSKHFNSCLASTIPEHLHTTHRGIQRKDLIGS